jgi:hypothetical protein
LISIPSSRYPHIAAIYKIMQTGAEDNGRREITAMAVDAEFVCMLAATGLEGSFSCGIG